MNFRLESGSPSRDSAAYDARPLAASIIRLVLVCWLVTFFDGFDLNVIAFAAPYLSSAYDLDKHMLANVFSSGIAGTLLGGILFGSLGDRIGRRRSIILSTSMFGLLTLAFALAEGYRSLLGLRFVSGLALGGALPMVWALSVESAPRRYRATIVTIIMLGYGFGIFAAGPVSIGLIPRFGWQAVFIFGGSASLLAALLLYIALPESLRFIAVRDGANAAAMRAFPDDTRTALALPRPEPTGLAGVLLLFRENLRWLTPLLWIAYAASSINTFFFATWGPLLFEEMGLSRSTAAWTSSLNSVAGAAGALLLMRFTDRIGAISISLLPAIAVPFLLIIGFVPMSHTVFLTMMASLYVFLGGSHYGIISIAGIFYPTAYRGLGTGWAAAVGKLGSVAGPWVGGWLMAGRLPPQRTFVALAVCPAIFFLCMLAIGLMERGAHVRAQD